MYLKSVFGTRFLKVSAAVIVATSLLAALLAYQVESAHQTVRRARRLKGMVMLCVALMYHADDHGRLPLAHTTNQDGVAMQSWRVLLLPQLSQDSLYSRINRNEPWDSQANRRWWESMPEDYWSPAEEERNSTTTSYVAVLGPHATWWGPEGTKPSKAPSPDAVMLIELVGSSIPWMAPRDATVEELLDILCPKGEGNGGSEHAVDFCYVTVGGDVREANRSINRAELRKLLLGEGQSDRNGG